MKLSTACDSSSFSQSAGLYNTNYLTQPFGKGGSAVSVLASNRKAELSGSVQKPAGEAESLRVASLLCSHHGATAALSILGAWGFMPLTG